MPSMSLPLNPATLAAFRPPPMNPFQMAPASMGGAPTPHGMAPPPAMPAFQGNAQPGPFAQPAPFNPLLAQAIMGIRGMGGPMGASGGGMPQGVGPSGASVAPPGSFGVTPGSQRPARRNPYLSR